MTIPIGAPASRAFPPGLLITRATRAKCSSLRFWASQFRGGFHSHGGTPKWMVYMGKTHLKKNDLGVGKCPFFVFLFLFTFKFGNYIPKSWVMWKIGTSIPSPDLPEAWLEHLKVQIWENVFPGGLQLGKSSINGACGENSSKSSRWIFQRFPEGR